MTPQAKYLQQAAQILPSVRQENPYLKDQVGHLIYNFVEMIVGNQMAPKITGMLIELPVDQIRQYLQSFEAFQQRVHEASNLLKNQGAQQQ